ncbi:MAG: tetratricopeptide repeat protein [Planctomycetota bacterium]|nr:tetratricopeptide repeat protein [Planctomycetota bacterium]
MKAPWSLMVVLALGAPAGPAWSAEGPPAEKSVAARLDRAAEAGQRREQQAEALKICEEIVASAQAEPKDKVAAFTLMADVYRRQEKFGDAVAALDRMLKATAGDAALEQKAYLLQGDILHQAKKYTEAAARLRELIARHPDSKPGVAEARVKIAQALLSINQKPLLTEAYDEAAKAADLDPLNDKLVADALYSMVEAAWRADDMAKAAPALARLVDAKYLGKRDSWQQVDLRSRHGQCLRRLKEFDEARAYYAAVEKIETEPRQAAYWGVQVAETLAEEGRDDEALKAYERVFVAHPDVTDLWYGAQRKIAEIHLKKGRFEEALKAARICLEAARDEAAVAENIRTIADPLEAYGYPACPEREKAFEEARRRAGDDAKSMRFRAFTYIYTGKPKEALRCFMEAFARAGGDEFQAMGQDMVLIGARAVRGNPAGLEAFFQFVNYGPAGPDGKPGTADDLADPFAPLLK